MIPLDIFQKHMQNKPIDNKLEAWLSFLGDDSPERICELIEKYPQFNAMYQTLYEMCRNTERVMRMFSKELQELDRNTVKYMIEEQQKEIDQRSELLQQTQEVIDQMKEENAKKDQLIAELKRQLTEKEDLHG